MPKAGPLLASWNVFMMPKIAFIMLILVILKKLSQSASVTALLCDVTRAKPLLADTLRAFMELPWWIDTSGLLGHFPLRSDCLKYTLKSGQGPVSQHP